MVFVIRLFSLLPLSWARTFGASVGWLIAHLPVGISSAYRNCLINILLCYPELSFAQASLMARRSLVETGRTIAEFTHVWTDPPEKTLDRIGAVEGLDLFKAGLAGDRPLVMVSLHQSNWEVTNLYLAQMQPMTVLYQPDEDYPRVDALVRASRESNGSRLAPADMSGVKACLETLKKGGVVGILADHAPATRSSFAPFFGHVTLTSSVVPKLVQRSKALVLYAYSYRDTDSSIRICIESAEPDVYSADINVAMAAINAGLEKCINRCPEQYNWPYTRFREGPEGRRRKLYKRDMVPVLEKIRTGKLPRDTDLVAASSSLSD